MFEAVLLSLCDDFMNLLKRTEDNHARSVLFALLQLFPQHAGAEMKILGEIESAVRIESGLARDTTCAVLNSAVLPPARPRGVKVARNVVWNVGDD